MLAHLKISHTHLLQSLKNFHFYFSQTQQRWYNRKSKNKCILCFGKIDNKVGNAEDPQSTLTGWEKSQFLILQWTVLLALAENLPLEMFVLFQWSLKDNFKSNRPNINAKPLSFFFAHLWMEDIYNLKGSGQFCGEISCN